MKRRNDVYVIILRWFLLLISQHGTVPVMGEIDDMNGNCQGGEGCESQCGVYLAISSLPGVGIGMFAGRDFTERERLMKVGDQMIPIVDRSVPCLWDSYVWDGLKAFIETLGDVSVSIASPGIGAAANSFMDFVNVHDLGDSVYEVPQNMHRRQDPGVGAMTYYHSRHWYARTDIRAGEELFITYGDVWFQARLSKLGPVPITGDYEKAEQLYRKFRKIFSDQEERQRRIVGHPERRQDLNETQRGSGGTIEEHPQIETSAPPPPSPRLLDSANEFWDELVTKNSWDNSPTMSALPPKEVHDSSIFQDSTLIEWKRNEMRRSIEWLEENGVCADHFYMGESTMPQAGNGAFASRPLRKGTPVLPVPLIHIPDRSTLDMYYHKKSDRPRQPQLLVNYALGHRDSTLLLSPYGPAFGLVNHNQTLANVRLVWASPQRSQHRPERLDSSISELKEYTSSQLAMELVAIRDIAAGDEILLDYGDEWEAAWQKHLKKWKPEPDANEYRSAAEMNLRFNHVFRTVFEQLYDPYPPSLMMRFFIFFLDDGERRQWIDEHPHPMQETRYEWFVNRSLPCDVLRRQRHGSRILYTIVVHQANNARQMLERVPQEALFFYDRAYSTDVFLDNAFRHDIRIPDDIFPEKWKNVKGEIKNENPDTSSPGDSSP